MVPSAYQPDFTQVVLNHPPRSRAIPPTSHLLNTPGIVSTSSSQTPVLSPSAAGMGCAASLLASFYRPKLFPLTGGTELPMNGSLQGPLAPSVPLQNWLPQNGSFNPIRISMPAHQPIPIEFLSNLSDPTMFQNEQQLIANLRVSQSIDI